MFNFRFSTASTVESLKTRVHEILDRHRVDYELQWELSGKPFLTPKGELADAMSSAITQVTTLEPQLSTSGGTSDGRFIAPTGAQVVDITVPEPAPDPEPATHPATDPELATDPDPAPEG